jgi:hypothetical protein
MRRLMRLPGDSYEGEIALGLKFGQGCGLGGLCGIIVTDI